MSYCNTTIFSLQPTSSTAKIAAAKAERGVQSSGLYSRHRRPKSCKYDTYRLRSRTSVVEEVNTQLYLRLYVYSTILIAFFARTYLGNHWRINWWPDQNQWKQSVRKIPKKLNPRLNQHSLQEEVRNIGTSIFAQETTSKGKNVLELPLPLWDILAEIWTLNSNVEALDRLVDLFKFTLTIWST